MSQHYSDPSRESDPHALPDLEVFQMTAEEVVTSGQYEDEIFELCKRHEFRFAGFNSRDRQRALDALIEEQGINGGWFYWYCFPGCLPDSEAIGPFATRQEALEHSAIDQAMKEG
jgi:hypothetical protein